MTRAGGIGELLRSVREAAGRTREEQAELMTAAGEPCDPENLKRWETERRLPTAVWHDAIAAVYGLDLEDIKTAIAASRQHRRGQGKETSVDRRRFIGAAAAAAGVAALPGIAQAREGIDGALTGAGGGDIDYLASAFERHRGGYRGRSPHEFLQEMHGDITLLKAVMQQPHPTRSRSELVHIAAGLAGLVAIIQHDRGDEADAHRWFHTAERAARECGDRRMTAWVLARHAMVPLNYGAPEQAARLAAQARRVAGKAPTGAGALAAAVTARALAAVGDQAGARQAVSDVRGLAERLTGKEAADTWFGYPLQKHHVHLSQAYTLLGDTPAAFQAQDDALDLTDSPSVMTRALIAMDTAACLRADGDPGAAADMAAAVLDRLPESYRHGLVRSRVELLHHRLDGRPRAVLGDALGT